MRLALVLPLVLLAGCPRHAPREPDDVPEPTTGPWPDPPSADGTIGTAAPAFARMIASDGSWVVLCQVRDTDGDGKITYELLPGMGGVTGDDLVPSLVIGSGTGEALTQPLAASSDDRWVAVWRGGGLQLVDTRARTITELTTLLPSPDSLGFPPIWATFSNDARYFAWSLNDTITVRDLVSGADREVDAGARVWEMWGVGAGTWAKVVTDANGPWGISVSEGVTTCGGPWQSGDFGHREVDEQVRWFDLATGGLVDAPAPGVVDPEWVEPRYDLTDGQVTDTTTGEVVNEADPDAIAGMDPTGRLLVGTVGEVSAIGPFHWQERR